MEVGEVGDTTVTITAGLVIPDRLAVILAVPATIPVATPLELIVAVPVLSLVQVA